MLRARAPSRRLDAGRPPGGARLRRTLEIVTNAGWPSALCETMTGYGVYGDEWARKGATLSDKTARAEFGLTQDEIIAAIRAGKLQYRPAEIHGNPWLRLLRREVEDLVSSRHGEDTSGNGRRGLS